MSPGPENDDLPAFPWRMSGFLRVGLFATAERVALPHRLIRFPANRLLVLTVRYDGGDVRYDGVMVATPARHGARPGAYIHEFWTSSPVMFRSARRLWGVEPHLAEFTWNEGRVDVVDSRGCLLAMSSTTRSSRTLTGTLPIPCFTDFDDRLSYAVPKFRAALRQARHELVAWPSRLPALRKPSSTLGADSPRFTALVDWPSPLTRR